MLFNVTHVFICTTYTEIVMLNFSENMIYVCCVKA